jgi:hypothetical protein
MPDSDTVVATTSSLTDMGAVLSLVWEHILPALERTPLPADPDAHRTLTGRLSSLALAAPFGEGNSPVGARVVGRTYNFASNDLGIESLRLGNDRSVTLSMAAGSATLAPSHGAWNPQEFDADFALMRNFDPGQPYRVASAFAWNDDTLTVEVVYSETPFAMTLALKFEGDQVALSFNPRVQFFSRERPTLIGTA